MSRSGRGHVEGMSRTSLELESGSGGVIRNHAGLAPERYHGVGAIPRRSRVGAMPRLRGFTPRVDVAVEIAGRRRRFLACRHSGIASLRRPSANDSWVVGGFARCGSSHVGWPEHGPKKGARGAVERVLTGVDSPVPPAESVERMSLRGVSRRMKSLGRVWCVPIKAGKEGVHGFLFGGRRGVRADRGRRRGARRNPVRRTSWCASRSRPATRASSESCSAGVVVCEPIAAGDEGVVGILFGGRRGVRVGRRAVAGDLLPVTCLTCH